eukprot:6719962-Prymnesium_polylepis.1
MEIWLRLLDRLDGQRVSGDDADDSIPHCKAALPDTLRHPVSSRMTGAAWADVCDTSLLRAGKDPGLAARGRTRSLRVGLRTHVTGSSAL